MTASDPIIYSTTGEPPDDPECELEVNTLADGTVIVSNGELDRPVAEVAAGLWRRQAERFERELDKLGLMYDGVCAEREALKEQIAALQQELARVRTTVAHRDGEIADWQRVAGDHQRALFETRRERDELKSAVERARDVLPFFEGQITGVRDSYPSLADTLSVTHGHLAAALGQPSAEKEESSSSGGAP